MEEWRDIRGFEGFYQVSSMGNIRSVDRICIGHDGRKISRKEKTLKPGIETLGYSFVSLTASARLQH